MRCQMKVKEENISGHEEGTIHLKHNGRMVYTEQLEQLARLVRYFILSCSTEAGSGHPTSSLSAADLLTGLMFTGFFRYDADNPEHPNNDRLIFSKGHA